MPSRQPQLPPPPPPVARRLTLAAALAAAALLLLAVLALALALYRRISRSRAAPTAPADLTPPLRRFSYSQLRRATAAFAPSHRLGQGGFGPVFRGALPDSSSIAVKLMLAGSLQGEREFHNEIALASAVADRSSVVLPIGYCNYSPRRLWSRSGREPPPNKLLLVYELMRNGSLQNALLDKMCPELIDWGRRYSVAVDTARCLHFLHVTCDPPVIHGDIKPSNVLLDSCLRARIADFGLARIKTADASDTVIEMDPGPVSPVAREGEDEASVTAESTTTAGIEESAAVSSPVVDNAGFDRVSVDSGTASSSRKKGVKDWWWRQEGVGKDEGGATVKDYVMEWIRSEIKKERPKSDWIANPNPAPEDCLPKMKPKKHRRSEWWTSLDEEKGKKDSKSGRPAREWWREEFCEELTNKQKQRTGTHGNAGHAGTSEQQWWQKDDDSVPRKKRRKKRSGSHGSRASVEWWMDGECRQRNSRDWASGDIPRSGTVSSTPSMRGTVCYAAPEYGGGSPLTEKCDVYSFGVLLLVLVSGRRPLQVTASPMSEFERANLISWARQLAHMGKLLDLLDPCLQAVDRDQALLCIMVALLCIQRTPARRPTAKEVVMMLTGQSEAPHLPLEFSPSPPGGFTFKSQRKVRKARRLICAFAPRVPTRPCASLP